MTWNLVMWIGSVWMGLVFEHYYHGRRKIRIDRMLKEVWDFTTLREAYYEAQYR